MNRFVSYKYAKHVKNLRPQIKKNYHYTNQSNEEMVHYWDKHFNLPIKQHINTTEAASEMRRWYSKLTNDFTMLTMRRY